MSETTTASRMKYRRVLLKISGEALMGDQGYGLHPPTVERIASEVKSVNDLGVEVWRLERRMRNSPNSDHDASHPYVFSTWRAITIIITSLAPSVMR